MMFTCFLLILASLIASVEWASPPMSCPRRFTGFHSGRVEECGVFIAAFRRLKPDIIHLSSTYVCLLGGFAALFVRRSRVVLSFTGLGYIFSAKRRIWKVCSDFVEADHRLHMESTKHLSTFLRIWMMEELRALGLSKEPRNSLLVLVLMDLFKPGEKRE